MRYCWGGDVSNVAQAQHIYSLTDLRMYAMSTSACWLLTMPIAPVKIVVRHGEYEMSPTYKSPTAKERTAAAVELSQKIPGFEADLDSVWNSKLKEWCHRLGISRIDTKTGEQKYVSRATKAELLAELKRAVKLQLPVSVKFEVESENDGDMTELAQQAAKRIRAEYRDIYDAEAGTAGLPTKGFEIWMDTIAAEIKGGYSFHYITRRASVFLSEVKDILEETTAKDMLEGVLEFWDLFEKRMRVRFATEAKQKKKEHNRVVAKREFEKVGVDTEAVMSWACEVLENGGGTWVEVSVALSLVSGRRQAEIHSSAEFMATIDSLPDCDHEYWASWRGQLKTRGTAAEHYAENPEYIIPVFAPIEVIQAGIERLAKEGKRVDTPEEVNRGYINRGLREYTPRALRKCPALGTRFETEMSTTGRAVNYKHLRSIYALATLRIKPPSMGEYVWLAGILGHDRTTNDAGRYQPETLATSARVYAADFFEAGI